MKRAFALFFVFLLLAGAAGGLGWFQFRVKPEMIKGFIKAAGQPTPSVAATEASLETWPPQLRAIGTFRAVAGVEVAPQVGGVIRTIRFESAQDVKKGDILVEIDDAIDQADLKAGQAALLNTSSTFERQNQLVSGGTTSIANVDQARAARDQAAAQVERVKAVIAQKKVAAPFDGRLGIRRIDIGQYVSAGTALITLQQLDPIYADFPMPEQALSKLSVGQGVDVVADAFAGRTFTGTIKFLDSRVSPDTRNFLVRAEIRNADKKLLPGMFANVVVKAGKPAQVVTVPRTAIAYSLYGDSVILLQPQPQTQPQTSAAGSAQAAPASTASAPTDQVFMTDRRSVKVGDVRGDRVAILDGLAKGDRIVTQGQIKLQPGARVKIDPDSGFKPMSPLPKE